MPAISVKTFAGERPKVDPRLLPNESAAKAYGCHFDNGNLSPLKSPVLTGISVISNAKTIYKHLNEYWFSWDKAVNAVASPVANDPWQRVYFTGDGYPKVTNPQRFPVKFYLVAMLFVVFDVEIIFLFAWASRFSDLGWYGIGAVIIFTFFVLETLAYVWKRGALDWNVKRRARYLVEEEAA